MVQTSTWNQNQPGLSFNRMEMMISNHVPFVNLWQALSN